MTAGAGFMCQNQARIGDPLERLALVTLLSPGPVGRLAKLTGFFVSHRSTAASNVSNCPTRAGASNRRFPPASPRSLRQAPQPKPRAYRSGVEALKETSNL